MAEASFDDVAALVALGVELWWSATAVSAVLPVPGLITGLSDGGSDPTLSEVGPYCSGGVGLIAEKLIRSCSWSACSEARNVDLLDEGNQCWGVIGLPRRDDRGQRQAVTIDELVDLRGQAAAGASYCVIRRLDPRFRVIR